MLHGFAGCRDGMKLMRELHADFWDTCFPEIDEGDMEGRANVLAFFDRQVALALRKAPLTRAPGMNFSWIEWTESRPFDLPETVTGPLDGEMQARLSELKHQAAEENKTSGEDFRKAKALDPKLFYEDASKALAPGWEEFQRLDRVMDEKFARQTPGLGELKKAIEEVRRLVDGILKEKRALEPDPAGTGGGEAPGERWRERGGSGLPRRRAHGADPGPGRGPRTARRGRGILPPDRAPQPRFVPRPARDHLGPDAAGVVARGRDQGHRPSWIRSGKLSESVPARPNEGGRPRRTAQGKLRESRQGGTLMAKKESIQHKLKRVRPPRVHITYDVEVGGAIELKELPFVVGVLGDFSGQPEEPLPADEGPQVRRDRPRQLRPGSGRA